MTGVNGAAELRSLRLLLFSEAGVRFGADADLIESICELSPDVEMEKIFRLNEKLKCRHELSADSSLTTLKVRGKKASYLIAVDRIEEIIEIGIDAIRPMPMLVMPYSIKIGIWGVVPRTDGLLLLIDFTRLQAGDNRGDNDGI